MNISDEKRLDAMIVIWSKSVDVQQHFNGICMTIRNIYVTLVAALLAFGAAISSGLLSARVGVPNLGLVIFSVSLVVAVVSLLFYFVDRHWYHRLLVGAVKDGILLERKIREVLPAIGLTERIGAESPIDISHKNFGSRLLSFATWMTGVDRERVVLERKVHSDAKLGIFYFAIVYIALVLGVVGLFAFG